MRNYFLITDRIGFSNWTANDMDLARSIWGDAGFTRFICAAGKFSDQEIEIG